MRTSPHFEDNLPYRYRGPRKQFDRGFRKDLALVVQYESHASGDLQIRALGQLQTHPHCPLAARPHPVLIRPLPGDELMGADMSRPHTQSRTARPPTMLCDGPARDRLATITCWQRTVQLSQHAHRVLCSGEDSIWRTFLRAPDALFERAIETHGSAWTRTHCDSSPATWSATK